MRIITHLKNITGIFIAVCVYICFFTNAEIIKETILSSLTFCLNTLIPAIFPYMIISSIFSSSSLINKGLRGIFSPIFNILGICKTYTSPIVFGNLCGFLNGPKLITEFSCNELTKNDFNRLIILSSNAGLSFLILVVGKKMWGNIPFALSLYFFQIFVSFIINFSFLKMKNYNIKNSNTSFFKNFTNAITSSTNTIMYVCSFTVFTSIVLNLISSIFRLNKGSIMYIAFASFLDITQGVISATIHPNIFVNSFFTGFSVGFGGLSVIFQTFAICSTFDINRRKFILMKFIQGITCGIFSFLFAVIFSVKPITYVPTGGIKPYNFYIFVFLLLLFLKFVIRSVDFLKKILYNIIK